MGDYEPGKVYALRRNGELKFYRFRGGDVSKRSNWQELGPAPAGLEGHVGPVQQDSTAPESVGALRADRPRMGTDFLRSVAQGATQGFGDEMVGAQAGAAAGGHPDPMSFIDAGAGATIPHPGVEMGGREEAAAATEASRANMDRIRQERPVMNFIGEAAGGMAAPAGIGSAVGKQVVARTGNRLAGGLLGAGVGGGAAGALIGAGEADEGSMLGGAATGGLVGTAAGGLFGGAGAGLGKMAMRAGGFSGDAHAHARATLDRYLRRAGIDGEEQLAARMDELPQGSVVADADPSLARAARAQTNQDAGLIAEGGPVSRLQERFTNRGDRLADDMRGGSGLTRTYLESLDAAEGAIDRVRAQYFKPLEELYPAVDDPRISEVLQLPEVREVIGERAQGVLDGERLPSFMDLQRAMFRLRDKARKAGAEMEFELAREYREANRRLVDAMGDAMEEFRPGQQAYRIASKTVDAHELGRKMANKPASDVIRTLRDLPEESHDAFRQGLLDRWEHRLGQRETGSGAATSIMFAGRKLQDQIRQVMESDGGMFRLMQGAERERRWSNTWGLLSGNSTSTEQINDIFQQVPRTKWDALMRALGWVTGLSSDERVEAARMIGQALMSEGEEAARLLARELAIKGSAMGTAGAVVGAETARQGGGLFD